MRSFRLAACAAIALVAPGAPGPAPGLILADVTVIDGTGAVARPGQVVVITGSRIAAVLPAAGAEARALLRSAEARATPVRRGGYVIPGLIDAHVHLGTSPRPAELTERLLRATVLGGVTTLRDMGGDTALVRAAARLATTAPTPRIFGSYLVGGPDGRAVRGRRAYRPGDDPAAIVAEARAAGATGLKLYDDLDSASVSALATAARRAGLRAWGHAAIGPATPTAAVRAGLGSLAHADQLVWAADPTGRPGGPDWRARRDTLLARTLPGDPPVVALLEAMAAQGTALDPTLTIIAAAVADTTAPPADRERYAALFQFACRVTRLARRLGVPVVAGTDALGGSTPNLHAELQLLVDSAGFTPLEALAAATSIPARVLGADSLGRVAPDQVADLVLLAADPSADIRNTQRITAVIRDGVLLERTGPWRTPPLAQAADTEVTPVAARMARVLARLGQDVEVAGADDADRSLAARMAHYQVPGVSIALVEGDAIAWRGAFGVVEAGHPERVTTATRFQAGSISKPVAALTTLSLAARGSVALDADLTDTLRAWGVVPDTARPAAPITLRRLLSHSAALTVHGFDGYATGQRLPSLAQVIAGAPPANSEPIRLDGTPGEGVRYSGGGFVVLQRLLETRASRPFAQLARERVLEPLGMRSSFFEAPTPRTPRLASGHRADGRLLPGRWHRYPEMTAASLWSTPSDLARLILAVQQARGGEAGILPAAIVREFLTPVSGDAGLGIFLGGLPATRFTHSGSTEGFAALLVGGLDRGRGIVVMTNGDGGSDLAMEIVRAVAREFRWPDLAPVVRRPVALPEARLAEVVGRYQLAPDWFIEVARDSAGALLAGPAGRRLLPLYAASAREFFFGFTADVRIEMVPGAAGGLELAWVTPSRTLRGLRVP